MVLERPFSRDINTAPETCMIALKNRLFPFLMKTPQKKDQNVLCVPRCRMTAVTLKSNLPQNKNLEAKDNRLINLIYRLPCFLFKPKANVLKVLKKLKWF